MRKRVKRNGILLRLLLLILYLVVASTIAVVKIEHPKLNIKGTILLHYFND